jgi:hypothetical protein
LSPASSAGTLIAQQSGGGNHETVIMDNTFDTYRLVFSAGLMADFARFMPGARARE